MRTVQALHEGCSWRRFAGGIALGGLALIALGQSADGADTTAVTARIRKGVLTVTGTAAADAITLRLKSGDANTLEIDVGADGTANFAFDRQRFGTIVVEGRAGGDTIAASSSFGAFTDTELTTLSGEGGNDVLVGATGPERLTGGTGDDFVDGNQGADTLNGGDGTDVFQWDPGDGSDTLTGGTATDRLMFNGSSANEKLALTQNAGHVRLTRDIAAITLDLDDIETIDLRTLAGTDTITVNDLTGTDATTIDTDLAAFGGTAADSVADEVIVNGTSGDDTVAAADDGQEVVVDGLAAAIRIAHADPTLDRLTVNGLEGADTITATPGASALIVVNPQP